MLSRSGVNLSNKYIQEVYAANWLFREENQACADFAQFVVEQIKISKWLFVYNMFNKNI